MMIQPLEDEQTAQLLSQANLYRMRKQWDEATTCCMQVLYHSPENWRAHALLGDIYSDQDRPEEAIQWYCMTLDIRPESQSVREKLSRVVNTRRREIVQKLDPSRPYMDRYGHTYPRGWKGRMRWYWSAPERRRLALAGVVILCIVVIVAAPLMKSTAGSKPAESPLFTPGASPTNTYVRLQPIIPADEAQKQGASSASTDDNAPAAALANQPSTDATQPTQQSASAPLVGGTLRDSSDETLTESLQADSTLRAGGLLVTDAQLDPVFSALTVAFAIPATGTSLDQNRIEHAALTVARAALDRPQAESASQCTVRCLVAQPGSTTSSPASATLAFVGTVTRAALTGATPTASKNGAGDAAGLFSGTWWPSPSAQQ